MGEGGGGGEEGANTDRWGMVKRRGLNKAMEETNTRKKNSKGKIKEKDSPPRSHADKARKRKGRNAHTRRLAPGEGGGQLEHLTPTLDGTQTPRERERKKIDNESAEAHTECARLHLICSSALHRRTRAPHVVSIWTCLFFNTYSISSVPSMSGNNHFLLFSSSVRSSTERFSAGRGT